MSNNENTFIICNNPFQLRVIIQLGYFEYINIYIYIEVTIQIFLDKNNNECGIDNKKNNKYLILKTKRKITKLKYRTKLYRKTVTNTISSIVKYLCTKSIRIYFLIFS